jgi:hypothetical protein
VSKEEDLFKLGGGPLLRRKKKEKRKKEEAWRTKNDRTKHLGVFKVYENNISSCGSLKWH